MSISAASGVEACQAITKAVGCVSRQGDLWELCHASFAGRDALWFRQVCTAVGSQLPNRDCAKHEAT